ncbi:hypothetical protein BATDEDRAFT_36345 [Batrachochytrium dendrobatidis JAM81]|uniref:Protein PNS1 n=1 Tax=Batrachochytrium dendrobatidis (strain JAM81 / FGSC 10211) TaxID=684364 RepID=F4NRX5_BATDJ|nr:uncharacterized protein BATDEDRAFT_36345 [Batrachochytrium dendrobatidis JAM81]EGF82972.1 hypothetical protein BATDEDRAFT_36345 [Batrachochytrium dendrobatidis JAM81]KAJ8331656.1 pH nine-sensitive protein 1 [Batrachochytrium dendrobatidis]KAK5672106.1 pH nine-sensitive protein 1, variant 2 [Batrachochytrium dendrobatidis]|eukprot:XP_006675834.1 hypothetical protein BATDEDRAFT_36345 [Batrachochytrium dendrobatidis JAM81]
MSNNPPQPQYQPIYGQQGGQPSYPQPPQPPYAQQYGQQPSYPQPQQPPYAQQYGQQYGQQPSYPQPPQPPQYQQPTYNQQASYQQPNMPPPSQPYQQSQQYGATQQNYSSSGIASTDGLVPKKDGRFRKDSPYKDVWATIAFLICLAGFIAVSAFGVTKLDLKNTSSGVSTSNVRNRATTGNTSSNRTATPIEIYIPAADIGGILVSNVAVGLVLSLAYFLLMQRFAGKMIYASGILSIMFTLALAVVFAYFRMYIPAVLYVVFAALFAWMFYSWRHRIPFAKLMLKTVTKITAKYPATLIVGIFGVIFSAAFSVLWVVGLVGITNFLNAEKTSPGLSYFMMVFSLFVFYWTNQVIQNTVHITISGLFATYYFMGVADSQGNVTVNIKNPTAAAAKRALTTSFGPNCYGSLLVAIIQTLRAIVRMASENNDNPAIAIILCCIQCLLSCIQGMAEYFNKYAFTQVAIYGKDYCTAAKDTWELIKSRGIDAIINDDLIGNVLNVGAFFVGLVTGVVGFTYIQLSPTIPHYTANYIVIVFVSFFIGIVEFSVLSSVIDSGVATTFVCLAEDPSALARTKPDLYHKIAEVYPQALIQF